MSIHGLDPIHVRDCVVRPTLAFLGLPGGEVAERLIMGTAAKESGFRYLRQIGGGPALGLWQMEPNTAEDLWSRYAMKFNGKLQSLCSERLPWTISVQLTVNLSLACAMCRVHYYARPFRMPAEASIADLASIWKTHYNTVQGAGHESEFVASYNSLILPLYGK